MIQKNKKWLLAAVMCLGLSGLVSCTVFQPERYELTSKNNGEVLRIQTGTTIVISLPEDEKEGYQWEVTSVLPPDMLILKSSELVQIPAENQMMKMIDTETLTRVMTFRAIGPGTSGLKLEYKRPKEQRGQPVEYYTILLIITGEALDMAVEPEKKAETPRVGSRGQIEEAPKHLLE